MPGEKAKKEKKAKSAAAWAGVIKKATEAAGTYRPFFDQTIKTLAQVMHERDAVMIAYEEAGAEPVVEHTNNDGHTNYTKSPFLMMWDALTTTALGYWRDLGLTPAGLKKIDEKAMKPKQKSTLESVLAKIGQ